MASANKTCASWKKKAHHLPLPAPHDEMAGGLEMLRHVPVCCPERTHFIGLARAAPTDNPIVLDKGI
ncbi:hypothetical protein QA645_32885 [Bradyrhizobium sp. CIAT3101]|uniref:hypothetical protein n=1 Tax=Bradyrhizobium sp. CIAT3101 TaxID=439387 RepID=UPI0024B04D17|nr:hypothetical protein [Bradyrhizobium sp. CIAT3101]WFU79260.1 hypothetical protein QA645_32885 [Bradyrhizobium sp. CIAT3101]